MWFTYTTEIKFSIGVEMNLISNYSDINYENAEFANVNFDF